MPDLKNYMRATKDESYLKVKCEMIGSDQEHYVQ